MGSTIVKNMANAFRAIEGCEDAVKRKTNKQTNNVFLLEMILVKATAKEVFTFSLPKIQL